MKPCNRNGYTEHASRCQSGQTQDMQTDVQLFFKYVLCMHSEISVSPSEHSVQVLLIV
jgi:hypothetical protein